MVVLLVSLGDQGMEGDRNVGGADYSGDTTWREEPNQRARVHSISPFTVASTILHVVLDAFSTGAGGSGARSRVFLAFILPHKACPHSRSDPPST
jgi:hypothetical protein